MSSLPQGWHPGPSRNTLSAASSPMTTVPTTIRKKWNSPLASEVPHSKLPSYKSSNLRPQNNLLNNPLKSKLPSKSPYTASQNSKLPSCPAKPSPTREYQNEIAKLKKELTTVKAENSILKAKVRRVDDENVQKSRQIEKLQAELKSSQKNESANSKRMKDSELLLLRQKCLRLEGALKEKDLALKKILNEKGQKTDCCDDMNTTSRNEASSTSLSKQQKISERKFGGTVTSLKVQNSQSRASQALKTEVMKLRDIIHKLEKENQELQQQVKGNGQEMRRLKMQLKSKNHVLPHPTAFTKHSSSTESGKRESISRTVSKNLVASNITEKISSQNQNQTILKNSRMAFDESKKNLLHITSKVPQETQQFPVKRNSEKQVLKTSRSVMSSSIIQKQLIPAKQVKETSKRPVPPNGATFVVTKPSDSVTSVELNIEDKIQGMRENIAARKIQRSWRNHQKRCFVEDSFQNKDKAMTFIVSSVKHHKLRKEKLNMLMQKKVSLKLKEENEDAIVQFIQTATKKIWEGKLSSSLFS